MLLGIGSFAADLNSFPDGSIDSSPISKSPPKPASLLSHRSCSSRSSLLSETSSRGRVTKNHFSSQDRHTAKKGKRLWIKTPEAILTAAEKLEDFYCTFCWKGFRARTSWRRHEKEQHVNTSSWICNPGLGGDDYPSECPYCEYPFSTSCPLHHGTDDREEAIFAHLRGYRHYDCVAQPEAKRTFERKEHLIQHMKVFHRIGNIVERVIAKWRHERELKAPHPALMCPFCGVIHNTWEERTRDVIAHFETLQEMPDQERRKTLLATVQKYSKHWISET